jgi:hypothetical protein
MSGLSDLVTEVSPPVSPLNQTPESTGLTSLPSGLRDINDDIDEEDSRRRQRPRIEYGQLDGLVTSLDVEDPDPAVEEIDDDPLFESLDLDTPLMPHIIDEDVEADGENTREEELNSHFFSSHEDGVDAVMFNEIYASIKPTAAENEANNLLGVQSIQSCLDFKCRCLVPCTIRADLDQLLIYRTRYNTLAHPVHNGDRAEYIANILRPCYNSVASHHPAETERGPRVAGQRARQLHFVINNVDVCPETFSLVYGISSNLLKNSKILAKKPAKVTIEQSIPRFLSEALDLDSDIGTLHVIQCILDYAIESGAEKIPMFEDLERAERFQKVHGSVDDLSLLRLHECTIEALYDKYVERSNGGRNYLVINPKKFSDIFSTDKRLLHITLARRRDNFSICTHCQDAKTRLSQNRLTREQRAAIQQQWATHLSLVWRERLAYTKKAQAPFLEKIEEVPPKIRIRIALCVHMDKQTKQMTGHLQH